MIEDVYVRIFKKMVFYIDIFYLCAFAIVVIAVIYANYMETK